MNEPTKYTAYVLPGLSHARIDGQWERIAERLPAPRPARRPMNALLVGLTADEVVSSSEGSVPGSPPTGSPPAGVPPGKRLPPPRTPGEAILTYAKMLQKLSARD